jgi:hypothetical protein
VGRAVLDQSPAEGVPLPAKEVPRDRVQSDDELAKIILAAIRIDDRYGAIVELAWDELDLTQRVWTIPKSRTKNVSCSFRINL